MTARDRGKDPKAVPFYLEIREALAQPGCPFCRLQARSADRYLDGVLWEMVLDLEVRADLNQARGYCPQHGWLLVRTGAALGVAIMTQGVLNALLGVLASHPLEGAPDSILQGLRRSLDREAASPATARLVADLAPQVPCPVCSHLQSLEKQLASTLLAHLEGPGALVEVYRASDGLCLAHFRGALKHALSVRQAQLLVDAQQAIWRQLHAELGEFIRKKDYRFRDEAFGSEKDAWRRALEAISGPPPRSDADWQALTRSMRGIEPGEDAAEGNAPALDFE